MTTSITTRLIPAHIIRLIRKDLRIRFLKIFAIDTTTRAGDKLSPFEQAARQEALVLIDAAIRAQGMSHTRHLIR